MESLLKTPVSIITGFLGSGKTTLISNLIKNFDNKRIALIINEFGDIGVDKDILKSCPVPNCPQENIVELANGCICCTVADEFIPTMEKLLAMTPKPEHIIIETSGLALPKPLLKAFEWPKIKTKITIDGVIALADAEAVYANRFAPSVIAVEKQRLSDESINHETPLSEVFEDQINCADLILLTKCDTISDSQISSAVNYVEKVKNNKIPVIKVTNGKVDTKAILSLQSETEKNIMHKHSHHEDHEDHDHEEFETFIYNLGVQENKKNILDNIKALVENNEVLRIKGFIAIKNKPMRYLVQAVGRRIRGQFDTIWGEKENISSKIVIISQKNKINKKILDKYLNR